MTTLSKLSSYGSSFQLKVLSSLLKHKEFLQDVSDIIDIDYFDNPAHKKIVEEILKYYATYHTTVTLDAISTEVKKISNEVLRLAVIEQLKEAYKVINEDRKYIELEFSSFCTNQGLKLALLKSVDMLETGEYASIRTAIDSALRAGQGKNVGHEYVKDIEARYRDEDRRPIPTGWNSVDKLLAGGLGSGDLGIIYGNPGGGKSWLLVRIGAKALALGYNVIHYTLELSESYVAKRYDACLTGIPVNELQNHRQEVEELTQSLPGTLIVKEYSPGRATIQTVETHLKKCETLGTKADLVLIDYIDLLGSSRRGEDRKEEIDDNYTATKGLAKELKLPIWSVSQVNRAGAKDDIIEADKAAGSYNKIMIADFSMSLSRKRQDKVNGTGRVHIMKSRYGGDGMTYGAKIDTTRGTIEIDDSELDDFESDSQEPANQLANKSNFNLFNKSERQMLSKKFYEIEGINDKV